MKKFTMQNAYLLFALLLTVFMTGCNNNNDSNPAPPVTDTTAPTVTLTVPNNTATDVAINTKIIATFSEDMASATITGTTFTLTEPGGTVAGEVTYPAGVKTASFAPTTALDSGIVYTAKITIGATDLAGNPLAVDKEWTFTTG
ncbi:MAG: Ig-like domain-containing protein, partial [Proteobacteria bacterium]|nr:Ig-like domain-containing protein [Pseudomonadota bacterium]